MTAPFEQVAGDEALIAATHFAFPGLGTVTKEGELFAFVPRP